jgi:hypothetical protein
VNIRQFKDIVLGLKSDMKKSDDKFTNLIDQNSSYTVEMSEGVKRDMDALQTQMGAMSSKMKALSSRLERLAKNRYYRKTTKKQVKIVPKPIVKTYVQPKMEPSVKPSFKRTVKPSPKPIIKKAEKPAEVVVEKTTKTTESVVVERVVKAAEPVIEKSTKIVEPVAKPTPKAPSIKEVSKKVEKTDYPSNPGYNEFVQPSIEVVKPIKTKSGKLQIEE